jgi:hypothetical protein
MMLRPDQEAAVLRTETFCADAFERLQSLLTPGDHQQLLIHPIGRHAFASCSAGPRNRNPGFYYLGNRANTNPGELGFTIASAADVLFYHLRK